MSIVCDAAAERELMENDFAHISRLGLLIGFLRSEVFEGWCHTAFLG